MHPTFATPPAFFGRAERSREAAVCVAGIPYDIGTSNRPGARFGPHAIRHASRMLLDGDHPAWWVDPGNSSMLADTGDFRIALGDVSASMRLIERQAVGIAHLVALGGDHSVTLPLLRALAGRLGPVGLIHFDAHVDTWPDSFGQTYGHGSPFFHAINEKLIDPGRTVQIGIRSPVQRKIHEWTIGKGVTILDAMTVHEEGPTHISTRVREVVGAGPTYLSFDIDALDPAFAPGTGTPEIGGLASWQAQSILRKLGSVDFVGMDVVEVAPPYDIAEVTALAAATIVWEYLALLAVRLSPEALRQPRSTTPAVSTEGA
jgi:agmatinase